MENKENREISKIIQGVYSNTEFKTETDRKAFERLANIYSGKDFEGKTEIRLSGVKKRGLVGDEYSSRILKVTDVTDEGKKNLTPLIEAYKKHMQEHKLRRAEVRKGRVAKTIDGQIAAWEEKYGQTASDLNELKMAYLGRNSDGTKLPKEERTIERRYKNANQILLPFDELSEEKKNAVKELSDIFFDSDLRDLKARKAESERKEEQRDFLRIQNAHLSYKCAADGEEDYPPVSTQEKIEIKGKAVIQYLSDKVRNSYLGKAALACTGAMLMVGVYSQIIGCKDKTEPKPVPPITRELKEVPKPEIEKALQQIQETKEQQEYKTAEAAREKFATDPFKPVPEIEALKSKPKTEQSKQYEASAIKQKIGEKEKTVEAAKGEKCIDWLISELEKGISSYKFEKDVFTGKLRKDVADYMRKDPSIVLRFIGDGTLYETNKIGPNGEIEIKGVSYKTGASFGIFMKGKGNCGTYLASMKICKPQIEEAVKAAEAAKEKKPVATPKAGIPTPKAERPAEKPKAKVMEAEPAVQAPAENKAEIKIKVKSLEAKVQRIENLNKLREELSGVLSNYTEMSLQYHKMMNLFGKPYDYTKGPNREEKQDLYGGLKEALGKTDSDYMSIFTTKSTGDKIPKILVEFSNRKDEFMKEHTVRTGYDSNNPTKRVSVLNIFNDQASGFGKEEVFNYQKVIKLAGLSEEEKAAEALREVLRQIKSMREYFSTYWFERDVKSADISEKPSLQGHFFQTNGTKKQAAILITPKNTEVQMVSEKDSIQERLANDDVQIGETHKWSGGDNGGNDGQGGQGGAGGISGGGPM